MIKMFGTNSPCTTDSDAIAGFLFIGDVVMKHKLTWPNHANHRLPFQSEINKSINVKSIIIIHCTDQNINRDYLLITDYLPIKFEGSWAKRS